jgi:ABC-type dipeptide/oligopeptide/nickel transport system permease component
VTWIRVEKPTFDLVGVLLSSLQLTGFILAVALVLGILLGVSLIRRRRAGSARDHALSLYSDPRRP